MNADTFKLCRLSMPYIGYVLTVKELQIGLNKIRVIKHLPRPTGFKGAQRFVGIINYISEICAHLSDEMYFINNENAYGWTEVQETGFRRLKEKIYDVLILQYYDQTEELTLQCDDSEQVFDVEREADGLCPNRERVFSN